MSAENNPETAAAQYIPVQNLIGSGLLCFDITADASVRGEVSFTRLQSRLGPLPPTHGLSMAINQRRLCFRTRPGFPLERRIDELPPYPGSKIPVGRTAPRATNILPGYPGVAIRYRPNDPCYVGPLTVVGDQLYATHSGFSIATLPFAYLRALLLWPTVVSR